VGGDAVYHPSRNHPGGALRLGRRRHAPVLHETLYFFTERVRLTLDGSIFRRQFRDGPTALDRAGFPPLPTARAFPRDTTLCSLAVEADSQVRQGLFSWHDLSSQPGYAEAFDIIDAVIRQLSGGAVAYPTKRGTVVHDSVAVQP
jgi:hypothetical protein